MRKLLREFRKDQRGASLAVAAVMIMSLLSVIALVFDLGLLYTARAEAQRAADSAALAGAQEFLHYVPATDAVDPATDMAYEFALRNQIRNEGIDSSEVEVQVDPGPRQVWVRIRRASIPMWFARLFGQDYAPVAASAVAQASPANVHDCIAPLALPDWWFDANGDEDDDRIWDEDEDWMFGDDSFDHYERFNGDTTSTENGLGSKWRNGYGTGNPHYEWDQGRDMIIKTQNPHQWSNRPGWYFPVRLPQNEDGETNQGARDYRDSFTECRSGSLEVGDTLDLEMGNMVGPTKQAINDVIALDPDAEWDPILKTVVKSPYGMNSPRLLTIMLFSPEDIPLMQGGNHTVVPNNFARFFVEGEATGGGNQAPILGRFVEFAKGSGGGDGDGGSLVLHVQLIR